MEQDNLIVQCPCGLEKECFNSESGYKLCFTCGMNNAHLDEEIYSNLPVIYKRSVEEYDGEYWWPFMHNGEKFTVTLDLDEEHQRVWSVIPVVNGELMFDQVTQLPYDDFFNVYKKILL